MLVRKALSQETIYNFRLTVDLFNANPETSSELTGGVNSEFQATQWSDITFD